MKERIDHIRWMIAWFIIPRWMRKTIYKIIQERFQ